MQILRNGWFLFLGLAILISANVSIYRATLAPRALEVIVLAAGKKGSAALVRTQSGMVILVNAGPDASILRALGDALPPWQRRLDAVVLTGAASALGGGLPDVERRYRVGSVIRAGDSRVPYGAVLAFDGVRVVAISPDIFSVSSGIFSLVISSTTPAGVYGSDGSRLN